MNKGKNNKSYNDRIRISLYEVRLMREITEIKNSTN